MTRKLRVFVVEDNPVVSENLIEMITTLVDAEIVAVARTEDEAVQFMQMHNECDVYIIDITLREGNGLNVLKVMQPQKHGKWFVFSNHRQPELRTMLLESGADEVFDKTNEIDTLLMELNKIRQRL